MCSNLLQQYKTNKAHYSTCLPLSFLITKTGIKDTIYLKTEHGQTGSYQGCQFIRVLIYKKEKKTLLLTQTFLKENIMGYVCVWRGGREDLQETCAVTADYF